MPHRFESSHMLARLTPEQQAATLAEMHAARVVVL
jgi:hypothetical protein